MPHVYRRPSRAYIRRRKLARQATFVTGEAAGKELVRTPRKLPALPIHYRDLQVVVYDGRTSATEVFAPELIKARVLNCKTFYDPRGGGGDESATVFVPRNVSAVWAVREKLKIAIFHGIRQVFEGVIDEVGQNKPGDLPGNTIKASGYWGNLFAGPFAQRLDKPWATTSISEDTWQIDDTSNFLLWDVKREGNKITIVPKLEAIASGELIRLQLVAPTGQTWKTFKATVAFTEVGGGSGNMSWFLLDGGATQIATATTGSNSIDESSFTEHNELRMEVRAAENMTSTGSDLNLVEISVIQAQTETGTIDIGTIAQDIIDLGDVNSYTGLLDTSLTYPDLIEVADTNGPKKHGEFLVNWSHYGQTNDNPVHISLVSSERAALVNGKPVLELAAIPSLTAGTDFDFVVSRFGEDQVEMPAIYPIDYEANYVWVARKGIDNTGVTFTSPVDEATLQDVTKVSDDGSYQTIIDAGFAAAAEALQTGQRELTQLTAKSVRVAGPIVVHGTIRTNANARVPVSWIHGGHRIKIDDFSFILILLVTGTTLTNDGRTVSIAAGVNSDQNLLIQKAQRELVATPSLLS